VNWRGSISPKTTDVVFHHLLNVFRESANGLIAFLREGGISAGEKTGDVDGGVADHLVLELAVFPARAAFDIEHRDLRVEHGNLSGANVIFIIDLAGLFDGFDD
jgi:hypothetical protein